MSTVIKGGSVVTADQTFRSDILIDGETIVEIGINLIGESVIDACRVFILCK